MQECLGPFQGLGDNYCIGGLGNLNKGILGGQLSWAQSQCGVGDAPRTFEGGRGLRKGARPTHPTFKEFPSGLHL